MSWWSPLAWSRRALRGRGSTMGGPAPDLALAAAVDQVRDSVFVIDGEIQVLAMNAVAARLASSRPPLPAPLGELVAPEVDSAVRAAAEGTVRRVVEFEQNGAAVTLMLSTGPASGDRRFVVLEDLSGIASVDQRRRDFVANASHELQTPIAALMGMLELMEEADDEYRGHLLRRCQKRVAALSKLTRDLITLARAEDRAVEPAHKPLEVRHVCELIIEAYRDLAEGKGLALVTEIEEPIELIGDATSLEVCLSNLVQNAVAYTGSGAVTLRAAPRGGGGAVFEVEDTGAGIEPEILPRIFERFFRGETARSRETGGTGLGLSIVRNLVGRMGGRIAVSSQPGRGTRFQLELPPDPTRPLEGAGQALLS